MYKRDFFSFYKTLIDRQKKRFSQDVLTSQWIAKL